MTAMFASALRHSLLHLSRIRVELRSILGTEGCAQIVALCIGNTLERFALSRSVLFPERADRCGITALSRRTHRVTLGLELLADCFHLRRVFLVHGFEIRFLSVAERDAAEKAAAGPHAATWAHPHLAARAAGVRSRRGLRLLRGGSRGGAEHEQSS
jgi:hypothetical protein